METEGMQAEAGVGGGAGVLRKEEVGRDPRWESDGL